MRGRLLAARDLSEAEELGDMGISGRTMMSFEMMPVSGLRPAGAIHLGVPRRRS